MSSNGRSIARVARRHRRRLSPLMSLFSISRRRRFYRSDAVALGWYWAGGWFSAACVDVWSKSPSHNRLTKRTRPVSVAIAPHCERHSSVWRRNANVRSIAPTYSAKVVITLFLESRTTQRFHHPTVLCFVATTLFGRLRSWSIKLMFKSRWC